MTAPLFHTNSRHPLQTDTNFGRMVGVLILLMLLWLVFAGSKSLSSNMTIGLINPPALGQTNAPPVFKPAPLQIIDDGLPTHA